MLHEEWDLIPLFNIVGGFMIEKIRDLIEKPIIDAGYILDDVMYVQENNTNFLRIVIDKNEGLINVNDCVKVNELIDPLLDEIDINESYIVDICSKEKGCD